MLSLIWSFLTWWKAELIDLIPAPIRALLSGQPQPLLVEFGADLTQPVKQERTVRLPYSTPFDTARLVEAAPILRTWMRRPIILRLPESGYLRRQVEIPAKARRQAEQIADLDLARGLPFERDEIVWKNVVRHEGRETSIEQIVVRKRDLERAGEMATAARAELLRVEASDSDDRSVVLADRAKVVSRPWRWWRRLELAALVVAAGAAGFAVLAPNASHQDEYELLGKRLVLVQAKARKLREAVNAREAKLDRAGAFRSALADRMPVTEMLALLTTRLPDGTWLDGLTLDGERLAMTGRSKAAVGGVIDGLATADGFSSVRLSGAVAIDPNSGLQRFQAITALGASD